MTAYYNEIDPHCAAWLENLIRAGEIPGGMVDTRPIQEVKAHELEGFKQCHFFAGIGGWALALRLAGWPDGREAWTGSCPCQPFSAAGKRIGVADERHLWPHFAGLIGKQRPVVVFGEQVAAAIGHHWLDIVGADMEAEGYRVGAAVLGAHSVNAPHRRQRLYWVADTKRNEQPRQEPCGGQAGRMGGQQQSIPWNEPWQDSLARFRAMDDGLPRNVAATDAARNAIVPQVGAAFVSAYMEAA